jgi:hypothetical protein
VHYFSSPLAKIIFQLQLKIGVVRPWQLPYS